MTIAAALAGHRPRLILRWRRVRLTRPSPRGAIMPNPFVHVELHTDDVAKANQFYSQLFGWKLEDSPMPSGPPGQTYTMINVGEGTGGGMMKNPMPGAPPTWLAYVGVDN